MKISAASITILAVLASITESSAFSVSSKGPIHRTNALQHKAAAGTLPYFMDEFVPITVEEPTKPTYVQKKTVKKARKSPAHQTGVFSPVVLSAKTVFGDDRLNKIRGKAIGLHSEVIANFVATHESPIGSAISETLFAAMDKNKDGVLDEKELALAFETLGFSWLKEKQVSGILKRADKDDDGIIDYEEFRKELPKTLRTNLTKLAKKNGGELGKSICLRLIKLSQPVLFF